MKTIWACFLVLLLTSRARADSDPLVSGVLFIAPTLSTDVAAAHVAAATTAARENGLEPALLLSMAYIESRYQPEATSRVEKGKRKTGLWASDKPAGTGPWFCGVMQTQAKFDWKSCLAQRDIVTAYATGASELAKWVKQTRGDIAKALRGYGCGNWGVANTCNNYENRVFAWKRRILSVPRS